LGKIVELTVTKGYSRKASDGEDWMREEYTLKAAVEDEDEVEVARAHMLGLIEGWLSKAPKPAKTFNEKDVQELFPEDLRALLSFEQREGYCIIKPKQFMGSENFARIAEVVRAHGGQYVSAGKESHFKIPSKQA